MPTSGFRRGWQLPPLAELLPQPIEPPLSLPPRERVPAHGVQPPVLFEAVTALVAREDRTPTRRVFQGFGGDRFRTALTRACTATGTPAFSPHDLRHRRISLEHLRGEPWARIGERVGQRNLAVTANTYTHVLVDEDELEYAQLLGALERSEERAS